MSTVLVTGGTGGLGRPTVARLRSDGHDVRVLSRRPGDGHVLGDVDRDRGLDAAVDRVDTVVHLATNRRRDLPGTRHLLRAARDAGAGHLVYISIVGADRIPYFYYRDKVANEHAVESSGLPWTILRATQFHSFPIEILKMQGRMPTLFAPDLRLQPISTEETAARLAELVAGGPGGRVADIGGPEIVGFADVAERWRETTGERRRIRPVRLPGRTFRAFREEHHIPGVPGYGRITFDDWLAGEVAEA